MRNKLYDLARVGLCLIVASSIVAPSYGAAPFANVAQAVTFSEKVQMIESQLTIFSADTEASVSLDDAQATNDSDATSANAEISTTSGTTDADKAKKAYEDALAAEKAAAETLKTKVSEHKGAIKSQETAQSNVDVAGTAGDTALTTAAGTVRQAVTNAETKLNEAKAAKETADKAVETQQQYVADKEKELSDLIGNNAGLMQAKQALETALDNLAEAERAMNNANFAWADLSRKHAEKNTEVQNLNTLVGQKEQAYNDAQAATTAAKTAYDEAVAALNAAENPEASLTGAVEAAQGKLTTAQSQQTTAYQALQASYTDLATAKAQLSTLWEQYQAALNAGGGSGGGDNPGGGDTPSNPGADIAALKQAVTDAQANYNNALADDSNVRAAQSALAAAQNKLTELGNNKAYYDGEVLRLQAVLAQIQAATSFDSNGWPVDSDGVTPIYDANSNPIQMTQADCEGAIATAQQNATDVDVDGKQTALNSAIETAKQDTTSSVYTYWNALTTAKTEWQNAGGTFDSKGNPVDPASQVSAAEATADELKAQYDALKALTDACDAADTAVATAEEELRQAQAALPTEARLAELRTAVDTAKATADGKAALEAEAKTTWENAQAAYDTANAENIRLGEQEDAAKTTFGTKKELFTAAGGVLDADGNAVANSYTDVINTPQANYNAALASSGLGADVITAIGELDTQVKELKNNLQGAKGDADTCATNLAAAQEKYDAAALKAGKLDGLTFAVIAANPATYYELFGAESPVFEKVTDYTTKVGALNEAKTAVENAAKAESTAQESYDNVYKNLEIARDNYAKYNTELPAMPEKPAPTNPGGNTGDNNGGNTGDNNGGNTGDNNGGNTGDNNGGNTGDNNGGDNNGTGDNNGGDNNGTGDNNGGNGNGTGDNNGTKKPTGNKTPAGEVPNADNGNNTNAASNDNATAGDKNTNAGNKEAKAQAGEENAEAAQAASGFAVDPLILVVAGALVLAAAGAGITVAVRRAKVGAEK